jgi:hypothetical protein
MLGLRNKARMLCLKIKKLGMCGLAKPHLHGYPFIYKKNHDKIE